ncbi:MAG: transglycosylase SLT domain-containing protein [Caldilineaceae bacterium]|nr:transglycosylase SLT domain-containing protein [Caldilineaceae bacterium]HRJ42580.1 transglycosylase SLT domain-containing protein [Caldilineaceae bacterium]
MPIHLRSTRPPHLSVIGLPRPSQRARRHLWLGLLLAGLAAIFLGLSLLALVGVAGLLAGLGNTPPPVAESLPVQPTPLVLVIPGNAPRLAAPPMPGPAELVSVAAAPLPTPAPTAQPQPPGGIGGPVAELQPLPQRQQKRIVTYADLFRTVGDPVSIDWRLLAALAYRESRMDPTALGRDGDMGLMQILPTTWDEFAPQVAAANPFDPQENVQVAAFYLVYLQEFLARLGVDDLRWVLAAYNWGPERVRRHLAEGKGWEDLPAPVQRYAADILYSAFGATGNP